MNNRCDGKGDSSARDPTSPSHRVVRSTAAVPPSSSADIPPSFAEPTSKRQRLSDPNIPNDVRTPNPAHTGRQSPLSFLGLHLPAAATPLADRRTNSPLPSIQCAQQNNKRPLTADPLVSLHGINDEFVNIITAACLDIYGVVSPRDFQIEGIHHSAFNDDSYLFVSQPTAKGKSLIPLAVNALRRGVGINLVPLIGLGSDQVEKAIFTEHNAEAYHADEHRKKDGRYLRQRLLGATDEEMKRNLVMN